MKNESIYCSNQVYSSNALKRLVKDIYGGVPPLAFVHSFGCQQNVSDGEKLKRLIYDIGYQFTDKYESASLVLLNTCAVRENAEDRIFGYLGELKHLKESNPDVVIAVCGCMAQQSHIAQKIRTTYYHVDLVFGTYAAGDFYKMMYEVLTTRNRVFNLKDDNLEIDESLKQLRDDKISAYVPIMYGCNNFCTYCIVPYVRGRERSREPEAVLKEVFELVSNGYKEITLLGQNVNSYSYGFPELLRKINEIEGDFRVRFLSSHPKDATKRLIDTILECDKICTHLHLPVQAGCDRVLKDMNRRYTVSDYLRIIEYAREKDSSFSFSSDIIVGFPGESYEEFCMTKDLLKKVKFDNIFSFVYSKRNGTKAALLKDDISDKQKGLWLRELLLEQREITAQWLKRFIGKTLRVLPTQKGKKGGGFLQGRCDENIIVEFKGDSALLGEFCNVKITDAMSWALLGEIVK